VTHIPAAVRLKKGRTALLLDCPFYGTLLFRLKTRQSHSLRTMATDGVHLFYNAAFVESLTPAELNGVLAHEVMHPALLHHTRRGNRSPKRWNRACDLAINPIILESGLTLPKDALVDARFVGMNAERIYNKLVEEEGGHEESGNDQGDGSSQASGSSASGGNGMQLEGNK
jgi:predicted metal-dependent peptidase